MDVQDGSVTDSLRAVPTITALPAEIDIVTAQQIGEELRAAVRPGLAVLVADMSRTVFCDCAAIRQLLLARDGAATAGAELRFVIPSQAVLRILQMTGIDRLLLIYPSLQAALASLPLVAAGRAVEGCAAAAR